MQNFKQSQVLFIPTIHLGFRDDIYLLSYKVNIRHFLSFFLSGHLSNSTYFVYNLLEKLLFKNMNRRIGASDAQNSFKIVIFLAIYFEFQEKNQQNTLSGCRDAEFTMGTAVVLSPRAIGWASTGLFGVLITVRDLIDTRR